MREILFKAKECGTNRWIFGGLAGYAQDSDSNVALFAESLDDGKIIKRFGVPETVCQYTGLTDINGNLIFEGDEVACHENGVASDKHIRDYVKYGHHEVTIDVCGHNHNVPMHGSYVETDFLLAEMHRDNVVLTGRNVHDGE